MTMYTDRHQMIGVYVMLKTYFATMLGQLSKELRVVMHLLALILNAKMLNKSIFILRID